MDKRELDEALTYLKAALEIDREVGYRQGEANSLGNIGLIYGQKGDFKNALIHLKEALAILDQFNLVYGRDIICGAIDSIKNLLDSENHN